MGIARGLITPAQFAAVTARVDELLAVLDQAGQVGLASSLRLYHNNDVLDGFVCLRHAGRQHNIRLSRRLRPHMDELAVGPLRLEILEPMRTVRLVLEDNEFGFALDVTCRSGTAPSVSSTIPTAGARPSTLTTSACETPTLSPPT